MGLCRPECFGTCADAVLGIEDRPGAQNNTTLVRQQFRPAHPFVWLSSQQILLLLGHGPVVRGDLLHAGLKQ
jgi:hypothetical protein